MMKKYGDLALLLGVAASALTIYFTLRDHAGPCSCSSSPASSSPLQSWVRG